MTAPPPILLIAAESGEGEGLAERLERRGHVVTQVEQAAQARELLESRADPSLVVVLDLARGEALKFLRAPMVQRAGVPVICVADRRKPDASSEALRLGIADLVARPVRDDDLAAAIANAREFAQVAAVAPPEPAGDVETSAGDVFGSSPAIRDVLALVRRVAPSRCNVLVVGERGTGREVIARTVHGQSPRRDRPFVRIRCGDDPPGALASVLRREVEAGATVYLSALHALPAATQRDLAEAIGADSEGGSSAPRFIASTHPAVDERIARGQLRGDLVDALGVVRIELPPLRQRREDIPLLATHFLKEACRRHGVPPKTFSRGALTLLGALPWTGNLTELQALTERLAVVISRGLVLLEDVLANVRLEGSEALGGPTGSLKAARERFERDYVAAVLLRHHGRMADAADELGIERTNLYRKIKQLNIRWTTGTD